MEQNKISPTAKNSKAYKMSFTAGVTFRKKKGRSAESTISLQPQGTNESTLTPQQDGATSASQGDGQDKKKPSHTVTWSEEETAAASLMKRREALAKRNRYYEDLVPYLKFAFDLLAKRRKWTSAELRDYGETTGVIINTAKVIVECHKTALEHFMPITGELQDPEEGFLERKLWPQIEQWRALEQKHQVTTAWIEKSPPAASEDTALHQSKEAKKDGKASILKQKEKAEPTVADLVAENKRLSAQIRSLKDSKIKKRKEQDPLDWTFQDWWELRDDFTLQKARSFGMFTQPLTSTPHPKSYSHLGARPKVQQQQAARTPQYNRRFTEQEFQAFARQQLQDEVSPDDSASNVSSPPGTQGAGGGGRDPDDPDDSSSSSDSSVSTTVSSQRRGEQRREHPQSEAGQPRRQASVPDGHMWNMPLMLHSLATSISRGINSNYSATQDVKTFSGDGPSAALDFMVWHSSWERARKHLESIGRTPGEWLAEMKKTLKGTAYKIVENTETLDSNYEDAINHLCGIFMDASLLVRSLINQLISLPKVGKNDLKSLQTFYATFSGARQRLVQLQVSDADIGTLFFTTFMEDKLPEDVVKTWNKENIKFQRLCNNPKVYRALPLDRFFTLIQNSIKENMFKAATNTTADPAEGKDKKQGSGGSKGKRQNKGPQNPKHVTGLTYATGASKRVKCFMCPKADHDLVTCEAANAASMSERWNKLRAADRCFGCLLPRQDCKYLPNRCEAVCQLPGCKKPQHMFVHSHSSAPQAGQGGSAPGGARGGRGRGGRGRGGYQNSGNRTERAHATDADTSTDHGNQGSGSGKTE